MAVAGLGRHAPDPLKMPEDPRTLTLKTAELPAFRAAVIACAEPAERRHSERLLGQLASLEAAATEDELSFAPAAATSGLARRAFAHLSRMNGGGTG
jgi:hypothetical protein